jgi:hypothetical protein
MEVRSGWNTDYGKEKFDVTIEECDLLRLASEHNIPPVKLETASPKLVFGIMYHEAEIYSRVVRARIVKDEPLKAALAKEIAQLKEERDQLIKMLADA